MRAAGVELDVIQKTLGHSTVVTTADTYITLFKEVLRKAADATAELMLSHAPAAHVRRSIPGIETPIR